VVRNHLRDVNHPFILESAWIFYETVPDRDNFVAKAVIYDGNCSGSEQLPVIYDWEIL
jgi:hypothetical protein